MLFNFCLHDNFLFYLSSLIHFFSARSCVERYTKRCQRSRWRLCMLMLRQNVRTLCLFGSVYSNNSRTAEITCNAKTKHYKKGQTHRHIHTYTREKVPNEECNCSLCNFFITVFILCKDNFTIELVLHY